MCVCVCVRAATLVSMKSQLTKNKGDVFASEKPSKQLRGGVQDTREPKVVRLTHQILQLAHRYCGEVHHRERRVALSRPHNVAGECVVCELSLAVQEGVAIEMYVPIIAVDQAWSRPTQVLLLLLLLLLLLNTPTKM